MVYSLAASPSAGREIYFAARSSGLYRSTDGGQTWQPAYRHFSGEDPLPTTAVVLSPDFAQDRTLFAGVPGAILRSLDGGDRWTAAMLPTPPPIVTALGISPDFSRDGAVFAATAEDGVFCSTDRGATWAAWNYGLLDVNVLALALPAHFPQTGVVYLGASSGLFRSANRGRSWREAPMPGEFVTVLSLAVSSSEGREDVLLVGSEENGLFASPDGGQTWSQSSPDPIQEPVNGICLSPDFQHDGQVAIIEGDRLLLSGDGGAAWQPWLAGRLPPGFAITALAAPGGFGPGARVLVGGMQAALEVVV
jgi:photosystem II stability/assembly factor-like uncharacterized protein